MFNMKLFIDTDADSRLSKRVLKDVDELGRDLDQVTVMLIFLFKVVLLLILMLALVLMLNNYPNPCPPQHPSCHAPPCSGAPPVHQLRQAGLWGVLHAHQEVCWRHYSPWARQQVRSFVLALNIVIIPMLVLNISTLWLLILTMFIILLLILKTLTILMLILIKPTLRMLTMTILLLRIAIELISQHIADRLSGPETERESSYSPPPNESRRRWKDFVLKSSFPFIIIINIKIIHLLSTQWV